MTKEDRTEKEQNEEKKRKNNTRYVPQKANVEQTETK